MILKLGDYYQIIGALKNCSAYKNYDKFKEFVNELEESYNKYVEECLNSKTKVDISVFSLFSLELNLFPLPIEYKEIKEKKIN
jgi:hypothetical protein